MSFGIGGPKRAVSPCPAAASNKVARNWIVWVIVSQVRRQEVEGVAGRERQDALKFVCAVARCGARFSHKRVLEDHGRAKHGHAGLACALAGCDEVFTFSTTRWNHIRTAHQGKFHACMEENCDSEFVLKHQLEDHGRAKHGQPKLVCEACGAATGATYDSISGLAKHKKRHHTTTPQKRHHTAKRG